MWPRRWRPSIGREGIGRGVVFKSRVSPSVGVRESAGILLDELSHSLDVRHGVRRVREKRGVGNLSRFPFDLGNFGALGEGLTVGRNTRPVSLHHHGIRQDHSHYVLSVGLTRSDNLPVFVSPELGEFKAVRNFQRVSVLGSPGQCHQNRKKHPNGQGQPDSFAFYL